MSRLDDDLLAALRAARPDPGYQPSATSPEGRAMLARVLRSREDRAARPRLAGLRWRSRPLVLAGLSAVAGAAAAAVLVTFVTAPGPVSPPSAATVRAAVLDAFERDSGAIVYATRTIKELGSPTERQQMWTYPAWPASGQQVRFRLFDFRNAVPVEDTESIYRAGPWSNRLTLPTTGGPRVARIIDVDYATRTWWRGLSSSVLLGQGLSPAVIRQQIASGGFTVVGTVRLHGRRAVELTWSRRFGPRIVMTTRLWVDARTYLPLQSVTTEWIGHSHLEVNGKRVAPGRRLALSTDTTQYHILPATPATLALLIPPIPAGFTRAAHSPNFPAIHPRDAARKN
jgi:hypothetical protein